MRQKIKAIAVIGEGITEKYYIESLKGLTEFQIKPKELGIKASSLKKLEDNIKLSIHEKYDEVYCLIDMDSKKEGKNLEDYLVLKNKYHDKLLGSKKNGFTKVVFIETERCIELWFLFHFTQHATTKVFASYKEIELELQKYRPQYEKTEKYFRSVGNLNNELTLKRKPNGSLKQAISNSENSIKSKEKDDRNYTYSEMHILMDALKITPK